MEYTQVGKFRFHTDCLKGMMASKQSEWHTVCTTCTHKKEILEKIGFNVTDSKAKGVIAGGVS